MVEEEIILTRGGVYLARLDLEKGAEIGKIRPVVVLTAQSVLDIKPPIAFVCPLSCQSQPAFSALHVFLPSRDNLEVDSYALVEHTRALSLQRLSFPRIAQLTSAEIHLVLKRLQQLIGVSTI
ncbi:MAG TPA: type II toxin-antitoxin system PemK/MazF family toxin [Gammaproteobacteria bacterium]|nr:type II toxin-antitoxin system PemK/MazF family toxin [Gammaproteobacteria bacterium]